MGYETSIHTLYCGCEEETEEHDFWCGRKEYRIIKYCKKHFDEKKEFNDWYNSEEQVELRKQKEIELEKERKIELEKQKLLQLFNDKIKNMEIQLVKVKYMKENKLYFDKNDKERNDLLKIEKIKNRFHCCKNRVDLFIKLKLQKYI